VITEERRSERAGRTKAEVCPLPGCICPTTVAAPHLLALGEFLPAKWCNCVAVWGNGLLSTADQSLQRGNPEPDRRPWV